MIRYWFLISFFFVMGCSAHVNIPPIPGDPAGRNPNALRVIRVQRPALAYALEKWPPDRDWYVVNLPAGSTAETQQAVFTSLPPGAKSDDAGGDSLPVYEVAQISIRGVNAQVDVVAPSAGGRRLVSMYLTRDLDGWYVYRAREWNVDVNEALRIIRREPADEPAQ